MLGHSSGPAKSAQKHSKLSLFLVGTPVLGLAFFVLLIADPVSVFAAFGGGTPTVLTPTPFTDQSTSLRVDTPTGAFTQSFPIKSPPGRNGVQPNLQLNYNSQNTEDSIVGYGWTISTPYIQRLNKTGSQDLYSATSTFTSSMDGELVGVSASSTITHVPRVDTTSNQYIFINNTWTMFDSRGLRYTFGSESDSRQEEGAKTFKWYLTEIRDSNDNYITYTYSKDNNELYPLAITYTGHTTTDGPFAITFATSTRPDIRESYKQGFKVTTRYRISEIDSWAFGTTTDRYLLTYGTGSNNTRSLLTSLQHIGYADTGASVTPPATTFEYASSTGPFLEASDTYGGNGLGINDPSYVVTDMNGNGINDIAFFTNKVDDTPQHILGWWYIDQGGYDQYYQNQTIPDYWSTTNYLNITNPSERGIRFFDINGDGKADVIKGVKDDYNNTSASTEYLSNYPSGGYTWTSTSTYSGVVPAFQYITSGGTVLSTGIFGDVNGDGLSDYVMALSGYTGDHTYLGNQSAFATSTDFAPVYEMPTPSSHSGNGSRLLDINGDGLDDWMYSDGSNTYVRLNNGTGWDTSPASQWTIATSTYYHSVSGADDQYYDRGVRFQDINGDGLPDFLRAYSVSTNTACTGSALPEYQSVKQVFLNTGNGWATSTDYTIPASFVNDWKSPNTSPCGADGLRHGEIANWKGNGQQVQDVLTKVTTSSGATKTITYTPSAQLGSNPNLPVSELVVTAVADNDAFGTIGTTTYSYSGGKIYLSNGPSDRKFAGFAVATTTAPDSITTTYYGQSDGVNTSLGEQVDNFENINRPFRQDVFDTTGNLKQRTLQRWDTATSTLGNQIVTLGKDLHFDYDATGGHRDTATEYLYATSTTDVIRKTEYGLVTGSSDGSFSDIGSDKRITNIQYTATSTVNVATSTTSTNSHSLILNGSTQYGLRSDTASLSMTGAMTIEAWIYPTSYSGNMMIAAKRADGDFNFFGGWQMVLENTGSGFYRLHCRFADGNVGNNVAYSTSTNFSSSFINTWVHVACTNTPSTVPIMYINGSATTTAFTSADAPVITDTNAETSVGVSANTGGTPSNYFNGKIDDVRIWNTARSGSDIINNYNKELTGSESGLVAYWKLNNAATDSTSNSNDLTLVNSPSYSTSTPFVGESSSTVSGYIFRQPYQEALTDQSGTKIKETLNYFDGLSLGSIDKGNNTKVDKWKSSSSYTTAQQAFNTYGLVASSTDPRGKITSYMYDAANLYIATTTDPLAHTQQNYYDYTSGKAKLTIDANGLSFQTIFDGLDRPVEEKQPDIASPGSLVTKKTYAYTDTRGAKSVLETMYLDGSTTVPTYTYFDGLDRVIQTRKQTEDSGQYTVADKLYNSVGELKSETLPYFWSGTARTNPVASSTLYSNYTYDALRRILTAANAVGTTTNTYTQGTTTVLDALGHSKDFGYDAYKRLIQVDENDGSGTSTTRYAYDAIDDLVKVIDAQSNIRNFTYDGLGRRLTAEDLHAVGDGTYGTWSYTYDDSGNMTSHTDAKGQVINSTFDDINRPLTEDFTGNGGTEVTYAYDSCTFGILKLCGATSTDAGTNYNYNALGQLSVEQKTINVTTYTTSYTYNRQGSQTGIVYPDSSEVQYTYNVGGLLEKVSAKLSGGSFKDVIKDFDYTPTEKVLYKEFANGVVSTYTYNPSELYRLTKIVTGAGGSGLGGGFAMAESPFQYLAGVVGKLPQLIQSALSLPEGFWADAEFSLGEAASTTDTTEVASTTDDVPVLPDIDTGMSSSTPTSTPPTETEVATSSADVLPIPAVASETNVRSQLVNKSAAEKANIKSAAIVAAISRTGPVERTAYNLQIASIEPIEGGVQTFVRAWNKDGSQIGFGVDGTVDTERFRIMNPPILVPDPKGDIVETTTDIDGKEHTRTLREDPKEALYQVLEQTISGMKNKHSSEKIILDKQGKTTTIFYPDPDPETTSVDGFEYAFDSDCTGTTYSTMHDATSSTGVNDSSGQNIFFRIEDCNGDADSFRSYWRSFFLFNTSAITATSTIDSATLSLYGNLTDVSNGWLTGSQRTIHLVSSNPASTTALSTADWQNIGTTSMSSVDFGADGSGWNTSGYNAFTLNSTGLASIVKGGISKFGFRMGHDINNDRPDTTGFGKIYQLQGYFADQTGTTQDPKLVVETSVTTGTTTPVTGTIQDISLNYDAVGNIISLLDKSDTGAGKSLSFGYDNLYRLTSASTTAASSTPYSQTYSYDSLGNITNKSDVGSYSYAGTGYANPHAATTINGVTYSYDANGNLTNHASTTNAWDYRNRLISVIASSSPSVFFTYDQSDQRVSKGNGTATTTYPNRYYTYSAATTTRNIYAGDELVATVTTANGTTTRQYIHNDWLGGTNDVTDGSGAVVQTIDYYPYGNNRINVGPDSEDRTFIGQVADQETNLSYLNARYYNGSQGQFLSEDPVFWEIAKTADGKKVLSNPQAQNSYSYAQDNPIIKEDPTGRATWPKIGAGAIDAYDIGTTLGNLGNVVITNYSPYSQYYSPGEKAEALEKLSTSASKFGAGQALIAFGLLAGPEGAIVAAGAVELVSWAFDNYHPYSSSVILPNQFLQNYIGNMQNSSTQFGSKSTTSSGGQLPRSANPTGTDKSGNPIYCWGYCGTPVIIPVVSNSNSNNKK